MSHSALEKYHPNGGVFVSDITLSRVRPVRPPYQIAVCSATLPEQRD